MKGRHEGGPFFCAINPDWRYSSRSLAVARPVVFPDRAADPTSASAAGLGAPYATSLGAACHFRRGRPTAVDPAGPGGPCATSPGKACRFRRVHPTAVDPAGRVDPCVTSRAAAGRFHSDRPVAAGERRRASLEETGLPDGRRVRPSMSDGTAVPARPVHGPRYWRAQARAGESRRGLSPIACSFLCEQAVDTAMFPVTCRKVLPSPDSIWAFRWRCPARQSRCRRRAACRRFRRAAPAGACGRASRSRRRRNWRRRRAGRGGWVRVPWRPSRPC